MTEPLIRKLGRFAAFAESQVRELNETLTQHVHHHGAREDIVHDARQPDTFNIVQKGWACRYKVLEDGRRQVVWFYLPGDIWELSAFAQGTDHSVCTITPVTVYSVDRLAFDDLRARHANFNHALWRETLVGGAIQREWIVSLGQRTAFERLAHLFCELHARMKNAGLTDDGYCDMPLTQADLGEAMGLSTVHVNRTLQELRALGLIVLRDRVLTIPDMRALRKAALFHEGYLNLQGEGARFDAAS